MKDTVQSRLITTDCSKSKKLPQLSFEALVLFYMLIPHFSPHGKQEGNPYTIKGRVVPFDDRFDVPLIEKCLAEISEKTNIKWFEAPDGMMYLHALKFTEHQPGLNMKKVGKDKLPSYSGDLPEIPGESPEQLQSNTGTGQELLRSNSGVTPASEVGSLKYEELPPPTPPCQGGDTGEDDEGPENRGASSRLFEFYQLEFHKRHGTQPLYCKKPEFDMLEELAGLYGEERVRDALTAFLDTKDDFTRRSGWTLGAFRARAQGLMLSDNGDGAGEGLPSLPVPEEKCRTRK